MPSRFSLLAEAVLSNQRAWTIFGSFRQLGLFLAEGVTKATVSAISSGTARNAPIGPHSQVQKAIARKTANGIELEPAAR